MTALESGEAPTQHRFPFGIALVAALVLVIVIVAVSRHAGPGQTPGVVTKLTGKVEVSTTAGEWEPATITQQLGSGDKLYAAPDATALVQWPGGTLLLVRPRTTVRLTSAAMINDGATLSVALQLDSGHLCIKAVPPDEDAVEVLAATENMTVRASDGICDLKADRTAVNTATVFSGQALAGAAGGAMLLLSENQAIDLKRPGDPITLRPITDQEAAEWQDNLKLMGLSEAVAAQ